MAECDTNHRTIIFGVDASEHSKRAFYWYIDNLWDKQRDNVMFIHALEYPAIPASPYPYGGTYYTYDEWQHWNEKSNEQVNKLLEAFGNKCQQRGIKFKLYKEENNCAGEVICKLAKDVNAQVIVLGSRGVGTLRRTFLGSVSDYCVHHAQIPVAIIPPPKHHKDHAHSC